MSQKLGDSGCGTNKQSKQECVVERDRGIEGGKLYVPFPLSFEVEKTWLLRIAFSHFDLKNNIMHLLT